MSTPPPPPHGANPKTTAGGGLPPGKYDIFIIPEHSAGSGFLYLPSLKPQWNSFIAGVACTLAAVVMSNSLKPAFYAWWSSFQGIGNVGMILLMLAVGLGAWSLGRTQNDGRGPSPDGAAGSTGAGGHGGHWSHHSGFNAEARPGTPPPPPPDTRVPPSPQGGAEPPRGNRPSSQWQEQTPPPQPQPQPQAASPPSPQPEAPKARPPTSPSQDQPRAQPAPPRREPESPKSVPEKSAWERSKEEMRRKEEERKAKEAEQKAKEAEQKKKEDQARRLRELREREAREREKRAQEKREREAQEKKKQEEETKEKARLEKERLERLEKEIREKAEKEAREKVEKEREEARERERRERAARLEKFRREAEEKKRQEEEQKARKSSTMYAFSSVGEKTSMWPNGRPPDESPPCASFQFGSTTSGGPRPCSPPAAKATPKPAAAPSPFPSAAKSPPPQTSEPPRTVSEEDRYSYRPYDKPKNPGARKKSVSDFSESSWAPSATTARTTPPPSRGPYTTDNPDKIVIKAVYVFLNQFSKTPASQLISGVSPVTDGLILRISTEGLFVDDDVRGVAQREWDVKAWTLKLIEVWCPTHALASAASKSPASPAPANHRPSLSLKASPAKAERVAGTKTFHEGDAAAYVDALGRACQDVCRHSSSASGFRSASGSSSSNSAKTGEWAARGLHLVRATLRESDGKRYLFVVSEEESWKISRGLKVLRGGKLGKGCGVAGLGGMETKAMLETLGWG